MSNLPSDTDGFDRVASQLTSPRQRLFRDPSTQLGIRPVMHQRLPGGAAHCGGFLLAFAYRRSLLGLPVPATDFRRSLRLAYRTTAYDDADSVGVSVFRTCETRPGWVPSLLRGGGVIPTSETSTDRRLPLLNGQPCTPATTSHRRGLGSRSIRRFTCVHPSGPFPLPVAPGWNEGPSAFPWASHPTVTRDARQGGNGSTDTEPGHTFIK